MADDPIKEGAGCLYYIMFHFLFYFFGLVMGIASLIKKNREYKRKSLTVRAKY